MAVSMSVCRAHRLFTSYVSSLLALRCVIPVVCRKTNGEVNISHENTSMVVWIYDGV